MPDDPPGYCQGSSEEHRRLLFAGLPVTDKFGLFITHKQAKVVTVTQTYDGKL